MLPRSELALDAATGLSIGARETQEDAVLCDMPRGHNAGVVVLADGLGGHAAGAVASQIAVSTAMSHMVAARDNHGDFHGELPSILRSAASAANAAILEHVQKDPKTLGMGCTLVILAFRAGAVHWLSIGDSLLYLLRNGGVVQLNETHSLAAQLDLLVRVGDMTATAALSHPDRHCLTSALGSPDLALVDCPKAPVTLLDGDMLVLASDGILTLRPDDIVALCAQHPEYRAHDIAHGLLRGVADRAHPTQDNLSVAVIRATETDVPATHDLVASLDGPIKATTRIVRSGLGLSPASLLRPRRVK